jgi:RHS repeat-associated protein
LTGEYQAASGSVNTSSTPQVQYIYSQPTGANYSRLSAMIYPNGRQLDYVYNTGVDTTLSRVSGISDDSGTGAGNDQSYTYLGLDTIVQKNDGNGVELTYIHQAGDTLSSSDGGDRYTGLDRFGRVIDQWWYNAGASTTLERLQYGYDRDGNTLYENNLVNSAESALYSAANGTAPNSQYDSLGRLQGFRRGTLSSSGANGTALDTVTAASKTQSWSLDALGNWSSVSTNGTAQTRSFNSENQISSISGTTTTPSFDNNGNMTQDEQGHKYVFNAWNQIVDVENTSSTVLESYSYDALGRRITATVGSTTTTLYYGSTPAVTLSTGAQVNPTTSNVIEERQGGTVTTQYVWGLGYVNALVLRDGNSTSGSYGKTSSGLGERLYVQQNANWNVTALVSTAAGVLERFLYDPYGNAAVLSSVWSATTDSYSWLYRYQGGRQDAISNLVRFGNQNGRDYSVTLGRFTESDTGGGYVNGANLYQAFLGAPISQVDPFGQDATPASGSGGSGSSTTNPTVPNPVTLPNLPADGQNAYVYPHADEHNPPPQPDVHGGEGGSWTGFYDPNSGSYIWMYHPPDAPPPQQTPPTTQPSGGDEGANQQDSEPPWWWAIYNDPNIYVALDVLGIDWTNPTDEDIALIQALYGIIYSQNQGPPAGGNQQPPGQNVTPPPLTGPRFQQPPGGTRTSPSRSGR